MLKKDNADINKKYGHAGSQHIAQGGNPVQDNADNKKSMVMLDPVM